MDALYYAMRFFYQGGKLPTEVPVPDTLDADDADAPVAYEPIPLDEYDF